MKFPAYITIALCFALISPLALSAADAPAPAQQSSWCDAAVTAGLTTANIEQLARDKLIIGTQSYNQIFEPYLRQYLEPEIDHARYTNDEKYRKELHEAAVRRAQNPNEGIPNKRFITSDALLASYHALFEDSFRELMLRRAYTLRTYLQEILKNSKTSRISSPKSHELATHILGPALVVLGEPLTDFPEPLRKEIEKQTTLIRTAEAVELPHWLGPPTPLVPSLDYRRCRPVGFYADSPALQNYFRAVRWLQMLPLRIENDTELTAWAAMADYVNDWQTAADLRTFLGDLEIFVGPLATIGLVTNDSLLHECFRDLHLQNEKKTDLSKLRKTLFEKNGTKTSGMDATILRVMPAHALPDAELLEKALNDDIRPSGLMAAAYLGSNFAAKHMPPVPAEKWSRWVKFARALELSHDGEPRSLYTEYLDVLRTLNAPPPQNAPAFMRSEQWLAKTCQTQLASWTQMRHTFALQAKLAIFTLGAHEKRTPPGFVEPNPAFWREFSRLTERTQQLLAARGIFKPDNYQIADIYQQQAAKLEKLNLHLATATRADLNKLDTTADLDMLEFVNEVTKLLAQAEYPDAGFLLNRHDSDEQMRVSFKNAIACLRKSSEKIACGELKIEHRFRDMPLDERWNALVVLSRRLETIARKQTEDIELNESDRTLIVDVGEHIAHSMGFTGDAMRSLPLRDDTPRWVEIAHDARDDKSLGTGIGRARIFHVLYPWRGEEIFCTGAVLPYYEEWAPAKRLTDDEWKQKLDSPGAPPPPEWITPILAK